MGATTKTSGTLPRGIVDPSSIVKADGRQIDFNALTDGYRHGSYTITAAANAAQAATSVTVAALPTNLPKGAMLNFGGGKYAVLSAKADKGATSIAVEALPVAIVNTNTAKYGGTGKTIPALTPMVELTSGAIVPYAERPGSEKACGLLATDATEGNPINSLSGFGLIIGGAIYENLVPTASGTPKVLASGIKTNLAELGTGWSWHQYGDSRGD